uniref:Ig-like domain-containing protein n=1 Tax=Xiphophorus maculatus TaxID=8083 RepID=M3ZR77_XIPMA
MVKMFCSMFLIFQSLLWLLSRGDPTVTCVFRQSCILPCNVDPSSDTILRWDHLTSREHNVHSYYDSEDQLGRQDQQFKGRTSLFKDLISRGNASLKLTGVKIQDEGRYRCYSSTERGSKKTFIQLKVEALIKVNIKKVENRIICSSEDIYPKPELTWFIYPPSELELHNRTTVHQTEEQLYSISSSLLVSDSFKDQIYSCTVSSGRNRIRASFCKRKKFMDPSKVIAIIIEAFLLWILIFIIIGVIIEAICKTAAHQQSNKAANQQNSAESQCLQITAG